uniref:Uncharacterized protein n=1 Tax=Octopus bimaculoides TaxID=37653 RepID=A0A0L8I7B5_OCTBM
MFVFSLINCLSEEMSSAIQANLIVINYIKFLCLYRLVLYLPTLRICSKMDSVNKTFFR